MMVGEYVEVVDVGSHADMRGNEMHECSRQRVVIAAEIAANVQPEPLESCDHSLGRGFELVGAKKNPGETHVIVMTKALIRER